MTMIENWRKYLIVSDCIDHELLITKLHAYVFDTDTLKFISSRLMGKKTED